MHKAKKGCVEIHWGYGCNRSDPSYQPQIEITLVKSEWWGSLITGFALSFKKSSTGGKSKCEVKAMRLRPIQDHLRGKSVDTAEVEQLLDQAPLRRSLTEKRCSYVEGLVESIQLQPRISKAYYADPGRYHLEIKRAETEIRLDWSDRVEVWPGVIDLVNALEEIYSQLVEKYPAIAGGDRSLKHNTALQSVELH